MLPAGSRLRRREEFASVVRRGRRSGRERLVVHLQPAAVDDVGAGDVGAGDVGAGDVGAGDVGAARAGFVVSRAVGGSVVRHRVTRQLRHLVVPRLAALPPGTGLVVRALPAAAGATSAELAADLDAGLRGARRKAGIR